MSAVDCWECEKSYPKDMVFDIPVFNDITNSKATIRWCFTCANQQLKNTDYFIIKKKVIDILRVHNKKLFHDLQIVIEDYRRHLNENILFLEKIRRIK